MPRGRKALPPPEPAEGGSDAALTTAGAAATELVQHEELAAANAAALAQRLGYEGPLQPPLLVEALRSEQRRAVESCLRIGALLLLLKEQCAPGEFMAHVAAAGWEQRVANRFMAAALRFAGAAPQVLRAAGSQSKLFELLILEEDELAELSAGGSVRGLTLDRIEQMSVREARAALREREATLRARDKLLGEKNAKIDALAEQLHRRASSEPVEREQAQLQLLRGDTTAAELALLRALATVDAVLQEPATEAAELAARHSIDYLVQRLVDACLSRGITVDLAERVAPIWAQPTAERVGAGVRPAAQPRAAAKADAVDDGSAA